jgi:hypothetical protein
MKIGVFVLILIVAIVAVILFITHAGKVECQSDNDCVKASCCHATSCVAKEKAPSCSGMMCTMECKSGTMDCGQGSCVCQNNKCAAKMNP